MGLAYQKEFVSTSTLVRWARERGWSNKEIGKFLGSPGNGGIWNIYKGHTDGSRIDRRRLNHKNLSRCYTCNKVKPISEFGISTHKTVNSYCYKCASLRTNINKAKHRNFAAPDLSYEDSNEFWLKNKQCEMCGSAEKLCLDHNHTTGKIRGCLCDRCNRGLGVFNDNSDLLQKAVQYLERTEQ